MKISFKNDYSEGAHPSILSALAQSNLEQQNGYGLDNYTKDAVEKIQNKLQSPSSKIILVSGGTQANLLCLSAFLQSYESIIACDTAHITDSEAGAIEATGHKIHLAQNVDGKISPQDIINIATRYTNFPHQVKPRLVFISNATELGTIYSLQELKTIYETCQQLGLFLYMDGARLGQAISSKENDILWKDFAQYTDAFYIGGTKNGALLGEAIVINNPLLQQGIEYHIKQKGALLAKGRLLGIQFKTLFENNLYEELGTYANEQAMRIKTALEQKNISFLSESSTNQIFPILTEKQIQLLSEKFDFYIWRKLSEETSAIRLITSWATPKEHIDTFIYFIQNNL